ncbi:hypothetical protein KIW84_035479 [Lathyrus oleraceus]|uniref:Uncharacterized protein n=1 Tax=Pisum sativum TaxID=3888 RepID=A0A9D5B0S5_PEA|nr:hypothetical protein KIW84_035479 [Pisum sativum]
MNFDESKFWPWSDDNIEQKVQVDFDGEGEKSEQPSQITFTDSPNSDVSADCETEETNRRTQRNRRRPAWMSDFKRSGVNQGTVKDEFSRGSLALTSLPDTPSASFLTTSFVSQLDPNWHKNSTPDFLTKSNHASGKSLAILNGHDIVLEP